VGRKRKDVAPDSLDPMAENQDGNPSADPMVENQEPTDESGVKKTYTVETPNRAFVGLRNGVMFKNGSAVVSLEVAEKLHNNFGYSYHENKNT